MKTQFVLLAALAAAPSALAHTVFTNFYVDGVSQGDGVAMRMRKDPAKASFPLEDLSSDDMACNVDGTAGVSRVQSVPDGSTLTFEIRSWPNDPSKERLDRGHKGPCAVYLKKVDSAVKDKAAGDGWFKLFDDGYDASSGQWCTDRIIDNKGLLSVVLPKGLQGGYYLARPEILALHAANSGDPQFYTGCAQIFLESSGSLGPEETVSIPGYVKAGEPSVSFDIYNTPNSEYQIPGPKVAKLSSGAGTAGEAQTSQTEGQRPAGCIDENANWCGTEVSSYTDEKGCWAAGEECWKQNEVCWDTAPPTGGAGCEIWSKKCTAINDACKAKNFNGPPNKGKDLTPKHVTIDVGSVMPTQGGGVVDSAPKTSAKADAEAPKSSTPAAPKSTKAAVTSAKPSPSSHYGWYEVPADAVETKNVPASENAPEPTQAVCPSGYECVYVTTTSVVTEVVYTTVYQDMKRGLGQRRRARR